MKLFTLFLALAGSASFASGQITANTTANCTSNLDDIINFQFDENDTAIATDFPQVWTLCPETEYKLGFATVEGSIVGGFLPLFLRSNMTVKCGEDGKSSNNCNLTTGSIGLLTYAGFFSEEEFYLENAVLSGITFSESIRETYFLVGGMGGQAEIIDCRFYGSSVYDTVTLNAAYFPLERRRRLQLNGDETPRERAGKLIAQHINEYESNKAEVRKMVSSYASTEEKNRRLQFPEEQLFPIETDTFFVMPLEVAFTDCLFENNTIVTPRPQQSDSEVFMVALITGFEYVSFKNTMFRNNDWIGNPAETMGPTALVGAGFGGHIAFDTCCFIDNKVLGPGYAMTTNGEYPLFPMKITSSNTYATPNVGQACTFAWYNDTVFDDSGYSLGNYTCVDEGLVDTCMIVESAPATMAPIGAILPATVAPITTTATAAPALLTGTVAPITSTASVAPASVAPVATSITNAPAGVMMTTAPATTAPTVGMTTAPVAATLAPSTAIPAVTESPATSAPIESAELPTRDTPPPTMMPSAKGTSGTPAFLPFLTAFVALVIGTIVA